MMIQDLMAMANTPGNISELESEQLKSSKKNDVPLIDVENLDNTKHNTRSNSQLKA